MSKTPVSFTCTQCDKSANGLGKGIAEYARHLKEVRIEPWKDYEFEFACACGQTLDDLDFFVLHGKSNHFVTKYYYLL